MSPLDLRHSQPIFSAPTPYCLRRCHLLLFLNSRARSDVTTSCGFRGSLMCTKDLRWPKKSPSTRFPVLATRNSQISLDIKMPLNGVQYVLRCTQQFHHLRSIDILVELHNPRSIMSLSFEVFLLRERLTISSPTSSPATSSPACDLCGRPVTIETAVTDEHGQAVHQACYLKAIKGSKDAA